jgi:hypothetical protein
MEASDQRRARRSSTSPSLGLRSMRSCSPVRSRFRSFGRSPAREYSQPFSPSHSRSPAREYSQPFSPSPVRSHSRSVAGSRPSGSRSRSASPDLAWTSRAARTGRPDLLSTPPPVHPTEQPPRPGTPVQGPGALPTQAGLETLSYVRGLGRQSPEHDDVVPPVAEPGSPVAADLPAQQANATLEDLEAPLESPRCDLNCWKSFSSE